MLNRLDDMLRFHQQALQVRDARQQVIASNIANADTPNYQARDLDFKSALQGALKNGQTPGLVTTAPEHLQSNGGTVAGLPLLYRGTVQGSVDGNTVDMDTERAAFADNALHYEFNLTRIDQQIKSLLAAIQG
ncbi:MAG: flagellar basal body rod protein FlgB [Thiobacillus sp.]